MAYSDYGAFVYKDGVRRKDKEDMAAFSTDEETFGMPVDNVPSGARIWASLIKANETGKELSWITSIHHGILGDGAIRVVCHKQGLPQILENTEDGVKEIEFCDRGKMDCFHYEPFNFEYKGYCFHFESGHPYIAEMDEPDGTHWRCKYDYEYGAGFDD